MLSGAGALLLLPLLLAGEPAVAPTPPACEDPTPGLVIESEHVPERFERWVQTTRHRIHARWRVPLAVRQGEVGTVVLRFTVGRRGKVQRLETVCATGPKALEKASRRAVKSASPLEPLPADAEVDSVTLRWRFHYDWHVGEDDEDVEYPAERWVR